MRSQYISTLFPTFSLCSAAFFFGKSLSVTRQVFSRSLPRKRRNLLLLSTLWHQTKQIAFVYFWPYLHYSDPFFCEIEGSVDDEKYIGRGVETSRVFKLMAGWGYVGLFFASLKCEEEKNS